MRRFAIMTCLLAATGIPGTGRAEDVAVIIGNTDYDQIRSAPAITSELTRTLEAEGFRVVAAADAGPLDIADAVGTELADLDPADRVVIVLSGHVVSGRGDAWLLGPSAGTPTPFDVGAMGVPVSAFLHDAARLPGAALVLIAESERDIDVGADLASGFAAGQIPQGVTVLAGPARRMDELLRSRVIGGSESLAELAASLPRGFRAHGFLPMARFIPDPPASAPAPSGQTGSAQEQSAWATARILDSEAGYTRYLDQYPDGANAAAARSRIAALQDSDVTTPERVEAALSLDRAQRQGIQRDLSILDYDTRGIDGIFGPGTRSAITAWQRARNLDPTGFLTGNQIVRLEEQAIARSAELEAEAAARRAEQEELDRALWADVSATDTEGAYRRYLERFPDGLRSEDAQARLAEFEAAAAAAAATEENDAWNRAREANTVGGYRQYLDAYPEGEFAGNARARIDELQGPGPQDEEAARAVEQQIIFNSAIALLAENQLRANGASPGQVDGQFDDETRRAIRRFQRDRGLTVTGYIDRATAVQLLAGR